MRSKNKYGIVFLVLLILLYTCACEEQQVVDFELAHHNAICEDGNYNNSLFYRNDLNIHAADPDCIYITEGEYEGWFFMYATSDDVGCRGIMSWKSRDMHSWVVSGIVFEPDDLSWGPQNIWAPEIVYDEESKLYYLFYSATNFNTHDYEHCKHIGMAFSESPAGPFVQWTGTNSDGRKLTLADPFFDLALIGEEHPLYKPGRSFIDANPFVDPVTNDKYLYLTRSRDNDRTNEIWGVKMKDWYTPDYLTLKVLTEVNRTEVGGSEYTEVDEGVINEASNVLYYEGLYYLTFSINAATDKLYSVYQAISDSPLGDFRKLTLEEGGLILSSDMNWDHASGTAHHAFVSVGDELWIIYHQHLDRQFGGTMERGIAIDRAYFTKNKEGLNIIYVNGPTYSLQPLPSIYSGYSNIASKAEITAVNMAEDSCISYLYDGLIKFHEFDPIQEFKAEGEFTEITISFSDYQRVRAVIIYNSYNYDQSFVRIENITFEMKNKDGHKGRAIINNLTFNWDFYANINELYMRPGGSAIAEFNEMLVQTITIRIVIPEGSEYLAISDIAILGI